MMVFDCREVSRRIASEEWTEFGWVDRVRLRLHLSLCSNCRRYKAQLETLSMAVRDLWNEPLDAETRRYLEERILGEK